jgi:hypothetical protein
MSMEPGMVSMPGLSAFTISWSGFAASAVLQKAISSHTARGIAGPRTVRNDAARTRMVTPVDSVTL